MNNVEKGKIGEEEACRYLISKGYAVIERNYRTSIGEIDIIAIKSNILTFIEVKARTNIDYGYPYEAVGRRKQDRIYRSSLIYMKHKNMWDYQISYDIVEIYLGIKTRINHIRNAFCVK